MKTGCNNYVGNQGLMKDDNTAVKETVTCVKKVTYKMGEFIHTTPIR